jgi:two-component system phosphate regulon sensor histidine kinase PhoR
MNERLLRQLPGVVAALIAVFGLGLVEAPLALRLALGLAAGLGVGALWPWRNRAPQAVTPAAAPAPMPTGAGRHVLERLPTPLVMLDRQGGLIFANRPARVLFERLRPGEHYSLSFRHPDLLAAIGEAMETGATREFDFSRPGDTTRHLRAHVQSAPEQTGEGDDWPRVICLFEDRTRDRQAEQLRTDFIANASHELRTPLASIKGFIETLLGPARDDAAAREEFLGVMAVQANRMQRLVDDLLSLSRIEMNQHQPPETRMRFGDIVAEVAGALAPVAAQRGSDIIVESAPEIMILGDHDQLCQALGNLVENALKYGRKGAPVRIVAAAPDPSFPGMTGVAVIDEGEGVAREHIPRLTERFYRVSAKRSRDLGGTGLGLAIVKHIAARHRGELEIRSEVGVGSRFTLWLPEAREPFKAPA